LTRATVAKFRSEWRARRLGALAGVAAALVLVHALGAGAVARLRYERAAIAAGEWWRLLSCHLVHHDLWHLALNLGGFALLWSLYGGAARGRDWLVVALAAALGVGLGLWFGEPQLGWYLGLSGVLHGIWAAAGIAALGRWRLEALITLLLLAAKLAFEEAHGPLSMALGATLPVVTAAHRYGALAGLTAAAALRLWRRSL
jgi:rhomboid family GlyGly-CTERM serine protease